MAKYLFYPTADKAQDRIWAYGCQKWGEQQAQKYLEELHMHLQALADRTAYWHRLPHTIAPVGLKVDAYLSRYGVHHIFFRELSEDTIGIMSILHQASDTPVSLKKDLDLICLLYTSPSPRDA